MQTGLESYHASTEIWIETGFEKYIHWYIYVIVSSKVVW